MPNNTSLATSTPVAPSVNTPPEVTLPPIPDGFVCVPAADLRGYRPMRAEMASVSGAVTELQALAAYDGLLGIAAPAPDQLAARLDAAAAWNTILNEVVAWATYARSQQGVAWKEALQMMEKMKGPFQLAAEANPALLAEFPSLARLLGAASLAGKRAAATRARKKSDAAGPEAAKAGAER
jgi:hypothetical protein